MQIEGIRHRRVRANGLRFHVASAGEGEPLALCLHGFPELWISWRAQLPMLAELGYTAWAPDLRGYGESERPEGVEAYRIEHLMDDVAGLIEASGRERVTLIAHDWGGMIAWALAAARPALIERLVILNIPHPLRFWETLTSSPRQALRSWYVFLFQLPWLPERMLRRDGAQGIAASFLSMSPFPERYPEELLRVYREAALRPGALTAMLSYYRAAFRRPPSEVRALLRGGRVEVPTLMLWGEKDTALGLETVHGTERFVPDLTLRFLPRASHWVQQDQPEVVNRLIAAWLRGEAVPEAEQVEEALLAELRAEVSASLSAPG